MRNEIQIARHTMTIYESRFSKESANQRKLLCFMTLRQKLTNDLYPVNMID